MRREAVLGPSDLQGDDDGLTVLLPLPADHVLGMSGDSIPTDRAVRAVLVEDRLRLGGRDGLDAVDTPLLADILVSKGIATTKSLAILLRSSE